MSVADRARHPTSRIRIECALLVFTASLVVYARTLAPTVTLVDSGELIVAASSLGVAHPPGFPLYVVLAHLATLVPLGNVAVRVNFASAFFAALASAVVSLVAIEGITTSQLRRSIDRIRRKADRKKSKKAGAEEQSQYEAGPLRSFVLFVSGLVAGLLLAFSRTFWAYATIAEVYTLTSLLILTIFLLLLVWRRRCIEATHPQAGTTARNEERRSGVSVDAPADLINRTSNLRAGAPSAGNHADCTAAHRWLYAAALVFGLALGVHHVSVGLMLPALATVVIGTAGVGFFRSRRLVYAAALGFAGLFLVYAYLPLSASRGPIMNWGDPSTLERLWWQVTGRQYQVFFSYSLRTAISQFGEFIKLAATEFGPWWLPAGSALALGGFAAIFRRDRTIFWFLVLIVAADLGYSLGYEIAEDKDAYYLPALIAMIIAAAFGAEWFINKVSPPGVASKTRQLIAGAVVLLLPAVAVVANRSYDDRSRYYIAQDYVENILSTVEPGGMLLTRDWQVYSPMLYFQEIERRRDDAVIIDINQLRRSWYFDYLRQAYPATLEEAADQVQAFLEDLRHWEHDPELYQRDLVLNQRISSRFYEMIAAFVSNHIKSGSVYLTLDIAGNREGPDAELTKSLTSLYQFIPQGLVFQITTDREFRQPSEASLITRGLADGSIEFEDNDVVRVKVVPVYVTMLYNRGRYLAAYGRHEQAIEAFKQSLSLNPRFALAQQALNESTNALRRAAPGNPR